MIKSMTGFGKGQATYAGRRIGVEIKTLNSKQLDLAVKTPSAYRPLEFEIRSRAAKSIQRGKAEVTLNVVSDEGAGETPINEARFKTYMTQLQKLSNASVDAITTSILRFPDVVGGMENELSDEEQRTILTAVDDTLTHLDAFRTQEGKVLERELLDRVGLIETLVSQVEPFEKIRIESVRTRVQEQLAAMSLEHDPGRLEAEMIFYLEKLDITEEKVRLRAHCSYFREVSSTEETPGRKLGFIAQEMGREINTMGSKANHAEIQRLVVRMKDELEKIKEQLLNLL